MNKIIKSTFREIKNTMGRFIGILVIIAIGCAFYTGLKSVEPDMKLAAEKFFDKYNFMDFRLLSTIGFNEDDLTAVKSVAGVKNVETGYSMDAIGSYGKESKVVRLVSIPIEINKLGLKKGRLPEKSGECVLLARLGSKGTQLGETIQITSDTDKDITESLKRTAYTVVGTVSNPMYITRELGASKIGNGSVQDIAYILSEDFKYEVYTDIYATIEGAGDNKAFSEDYYNLVSKYETELEKLGETRANTRYDEIKSEAATELAKKEIEYNDSVKKLDDKKKEYNDRISEAEENINDAQEKLDTSEKEISSNETKLAKGEAELKDKETQYKAGIAKGESSLKAAEDKLNASGQQIGEQEKVLAEQKARFEAVKQAGGLNPEKLAAMEAGINEADMKLAAAKQQLEKGWTEYDKNKAAFETGKVKGKEELDIAAGKLADSRAKLETAKKKLKDGRAELEKSKSELERKKSEAQNEFADAEKELADAKAKLNDASRKINDIKKPEWHILDRQLNAGYVDFENGTERIGGISEILPIMFFLIAALVCLTSMTRMVEEQRTQIGTLKALGYTKSQIAFKYISYAALASIVGSALGLLIGFRFIPMVIFRAYKVLYTLPLNIFPSYPQFALASAVAGTAVTVLAAYLTCNAALSSVPAALMRPQAPKAGKRLMIERVDFLWTRLKFSQKVTMRNIFRYKKRFLMTVFGVACCCALVLSGFGLKNSIKIPAERQFTDLFTYDSYVIYKDDATSEERQNVLDTIKKEGIVTDLTQCMYKNVELKKGKKQQEVTIIVPQKPDDLDKFISLRSTGGRKPVKLTDNSAIMTQKVAAMIGIDAGGKAVVNNEEGPQTQLSIGSLCENYLMHYVFMTPNYYKSVFKEEPVPNQILINQSVNTDEAQSKFGEMATCMKGVSAVGFLTDRQKSLNDILKSLDLIVWVIIISAAVLAFVVLYTLTTININERLREIATIKVLGFYDKEVNSYIFRESYILTFIGIILGLLGGIVLHQLILQSAAVEQLMYFKQIFPESFILAGILTFVFSMAVSWILQRKMKNINMVEALKSVE